MLADAFAAERLRLSKAKGTLFWGLVFVPIIALALSVGNSLFMSMIARKAGVDPARVGGATVDLGRQAIDALGMSGFFLAQLFFMIVAAAVLAGDYRWETWRLLTPRNTRTNLLLGKLLTFGVAAGAGLALLALSGLLGGVADAAITGAKMGFGRDPGALAPAFAGAFLISWLELMALAATAACVGVLTRNSVAALLVPVGVWLTQSFVIGIVRQQFPQPHDPPLGWLAALPALCVDTLRNSVALGRPDYVAPANAPVALAFLLAWIVGLTALALLLFKRQDLTRE